MSPRDKKALTYLGLAILVAGPLYYWFLSGPSASTPAVAASADNVTAAERRLARLRDTAATVPQKEEILKNVQAELTKRETGLIQADTAAQAQAQLLQILRRLAGSENPPVEIRNTEFGGIAPLGDAYGSISVTVQIECRIEQLVNILAAIAAQPEILSTNDIHIASSNNPKEKVVGVRMSVSAVVPRKLVPSKDKKGAGGL